MEKDSNITVTPSVAPAATPAAPVSFTTPAKKSYLVPILLGLVLVALIVVIALLAYDKLFIEKTTSLDTPTPTVTVQPTIKPTDTTTPDSTSEYKILLGGYIEKDGKLIDVNSKLPKSQSYYLFNGAFAYSFTSKTGITVYKFNGTTFDKQFEKTWDQTKKNELITSVDYGLNKVVVYAASLNNLDNKNDSINYDAFGLINDTYFAYYKISLDTGNIETLKTGTILNEAAGYGDIESESYRFAGSNPEKNIIYQFNVAGGGFFHGIEELNTTSFTVNKSYNLPDGISGGFIGLNDEMTGYYFDYDKVVDEKNHNIVGFFQFSNSKTTTILDITDKQYLNIQFHQKTTEGTYDLFCGRYSNLDNKPETSRCYYVEPTNKFKFNDIVSWIGNVDSFYYYEAYGFVLATEKGSYLWNPEVDSKTYTKIEAL